MYDPYLLHKYRFKSPCKKFYVRYFYYFLLFITTLAICYYICLKITIDGILGFILKGIINAGIIFIIFIFTTFKIPEFNELIKRIKKLLLKRRL
jgi:hypothetical protein